MDKKLLDLAGDPTDDDLDSFIERNFWYINELPGETYGYWSSDDHTKYLFRQVAEKFMLQERILMRLIELIEKQHNG